MALYDRMTYSLFLYLIVATNPQLFPARLLYKELFLPKNTFSTDYISKLRAFRRKLYCPIFKSAISHYFTAKKILLLVLSIGQGYDALKSVHDFQH